MLAWKCKGICFHLSRRGKSENVPRDTRSYHFDSQSTTNEMQRFSIIYFCKMFYMFQTVFPSIIRDSKLHIQLQAFVRPLPLPAVAVTVWQKPEAVCAVLSPWRSTEKLSETCRASYRNKLRKAASCWLYCENILAMHRPMNVKFIILIFN